MHCSLSKRASEQPKPLESFSSSHSTRISSNVTVHMLLKATCMIMHESWAPTWNRGKSARHTSCPLLAPLLSAPLVAIFDPLRSLVTTLVATLHQLGVASKIGDYKIDIVRSSHSSSSFSSSDSSSSFSSAYSLALFRRQRPMVLQEYQPAWLGQDALKNILSGSMPTRFGVVKIQYDIYLALARPEWLIEAVYF
jgi:hypothetical protein